jgi:plastocyanin
MPAVVLFLVVAVLCCAATLGGAAATDVRGSARSGSRPEINAVVWLETVKAPKTPQTARVVLDQRNLMFWPHVLAVRVGTVVDFPNNDRVFHNVFSFRDGKRFDLGMYPVGTVRKVTFDRAGLSRIFCNIHPQMAAYVMAVDSPYFGTTDQSGAFTIADVPADSYAYRAWKPGGPILTGSFSAQPARALDVQWP